ncbi:hypothetical protein NST84_05155 [Paenibacillus sp. FSL R7-0345]|uniref:hypothetical protein n=1 Tax=Paenibacillus sp. FSL R7-0345 TaxID=2954535 RepID=UPI00315AAF62
MNILNGKSYLLPGQVQLGVQVETKFNAFMRNVLADKHEASWCRRPVMELVGFLLSICLYYLLQLNLVGKTPPNSHEMLLCGQNRLI